MIPAQADVVVIGAGPVGSMAAGLLAEKGYQVVLLDKQRHPRYQVGESLIPDFWKYCDALGVSERIEAEGFIKKAGGTVLWKGEKRHVTFGDFGYERPALHVERARFDQILFERAVEMGARAFEEVSVTGVNFGEGDVTVLCRPADSEGSQKIQCYYVVDASGQQSVVGRQLKLREIDRRFRFMSVWGYFENSKYYDVTGRILPASQVQETSPTTYVASLPQADHIGWLWHIMLRQNTSVGFVVPVEAIKQLKEDVSWEAFYLDLCQQAPLLPNLLDEASFVPDSVQLIRDYSYRLRNVAGPGYFLVGDAAGFIDPVYSNGVVLGMYSGSVAAWALDMALRNPEKAARYQGLYESQLQKRMELARALALPNYQGGDKLAQELREVWQLASQQEKDLIAAAAALTGRAINLAQL